MQGDATSVPVRDGTVDAVTVGFGIRNIEDLPAAFREMRRVLVPGGRLAILEFALPGTPGLKAAYLWYFNRVLPLVGRMISRHDAAYTYLPASVRRFPDAPGLARTVAEAGFTQVRWRVLGGGIVALHTATVGDAE